MLSKISPNVLVSTKEYLCKLTGVGVSGNIFRTGWECLEYLQEWISVERAFAGVGENEGVGENGGMCRFGQGICRSQT